MGGSSAPFDFWSICPLDSIASWQSSCFKYVISKTLGTGILVGSIAVKLPQIFNIVKAKNVVGLSPQAFYSEVPLLTLSVLYSFRLGYTFTSYGESVMILIQNIILVYLLWYYSNPLPTISHRLQVIVVFILAAIFAYYLPADKLYLLPNITLVLMIYSRMSQIVSNVRAGTTGPLSSITTGLNFLGSLARIFTTFTETGGDPLLLASFGISTLLNGTLLVQIIYYSSRTKAQKKKD